MEKLTKKEVLSKIENLENAQREDFFEYFSLLEKCEETIAICEDIIKNYGKTKLYWQKVCYEEQIAKVKEIYDTILNGMQSYYVLLEEHEGLTYQKIYEIKRALQINVTRAELARLLKSKLGYSNRQVSVNSYDSGFHFSVKDKMVDFKKVEAFSDFFSTPSHPLFGYAPEDTVCLVWSKLKE